MTKKLTVEEWAAGKGENTDEPEAPICKRCEGEDKEKRELVQTHKKAKGDHRSIGYRCVHNQCDYRLEYDNWGKC